MTSCGSTATRKPSQTQPMSSFVGTQPAKLDEIHEPESDLHNSAQKGNFELELDVEGDLETEKRIFKYLSIPERYAKMRCPICAVNNDGQCCHFVQEHGSLPALKICIKCGKVGEHRSWECPNVASRSDTVINDKRPAPESESESEAQRPALKSRSRIMVTQIAMPFSGQPC